MPHLTLRTIVQVHPDVVWRELDGEIVLLNVASGLYYGLDEVGSAVWRELSARPVSLATVRDNLVSEYEGPPSGIEQDLLELVRKLTDTQLLVICD